MANIIAGVARIRPVLTPALIVYAAGVVVGVLRVDASPPTKATVALLWPLGVAAAVVTISGLLLAALVLFPMLGAAAVIAAVAGWWFVSG
jgi:hypothetical protein